MQAKRERKAENGKSTALAAVALQDHLVKSLALGDVIGPRKIGLGPAARASVKNKPRRPVIDTGRNKPKPKKPVPVEVEEKEYVLDPKPPALTLAQKMGLVEAPTQLLSEAEWSTAKERSNRRDDSKNPCVICKEDFGTQEQVLLSCTHVFHRSCLQAFERFTGRKTCPMCRKAQYQTRVIHEGSRHHRHVCATRIQSRWRGYVVRMWYLKLRETVPPKDSKLRQKFYEEKLQSITDRIVRSCDFNVNQFLREIDNSLQASRDVFRNFDAMFKQISEDEWEAIQLKAVERGETECPICLTCLVAKSYIEKTPDVTVTQPKTTATQSKGRKSAQNALQVLTSTNHHSGTRNQMQSTSRPPLAKTGPGADCDKNHENSNQSGVRRTVLLSCSHVFHETCLEMFEELNVEQSKNTCPVCRCMYQKKVIAM